MYLRTSMLRVLSPLPIQAWYPSLLWTSHEIVILFVWSTKKSYQLLTFHEAIANVVFNAMADFCFVAFKLKPLVNSKVSQEMHHHLNPENGISLRACR